MKKNRSAEFIVVTGLSGSGKTFASRCFEDLGYFCIDNLPTQLLPPLKNLIAKTGGDLRKVMLVMDVRGKRFLKDFENLYTKHLKKDENVKAVLVFLEASEDILVNRFSETRRPHPFVRTGGDDLKAAIREEKEKLSRIRGLSDMIIDTSDKNVHELKRLIKENFMDDGQRGRMNIQIMSFGFRHGIPGDSNLLFDVRFLPNPYYVDKLRPMDGSDRRVIEYVRSKEEYRTFKTHLTDMLGYVIPRYEQEGKAYLTVSVGCTAGKHRSVVVADDIKSMIEELDYSPKIFHRDKDKE